MKHRKINIPAVAVLSTSAVIAAILLYLNTKPGPAENKESYKIALPTSVQKDSSDVPDIIFSESPISPQTFYPGLTFTAFRPQQNLFSESVYVFYPGRITESDVPITGRYWKAAVNYKNREGALAGAIDAQNSAGKFLKENGFLGEAKYRDYRMYAFDGESPNAEAADSGIRLEKGGVRYALAGWRAEGNLINYYVFISNPLTDGDFKKYKPFE